MPSAQKLTIIGISIGNVYVIGIFFIIEIGIDIWVDHRHRQKCASLITLRGTNFVQMTYTLDSELLFIAEFKKLSLEACSLLVFEIFTIKDTKKYHTIIIRSTKMAILIIFSNLFYDIKTFTF